MLRELSDKQKHALWSYVELLCNFFNQKKLNFPIDPDRRWFVENRQRIHCLPNVPGPEEKFAAWFDRLEKGDEEIWARFLNDLSEAKVSCHLYEWIKKYSPFAGKVIIVRDSFDGRVYLPKQEGQVLSRGIFPVQHGNTLMVFSTERQVVVYPSGG